MEANSSKDLTPQQEELVDQCIEKYMQSLVIVQKSIGNELQGMEPQEPQE